MKKFALSICILLLLTGCAVQRSIPVEYRSENKVSHPVENLAPVLVTQWKDSRTIASANDKLADKAVIRMGAATFGISNNGNEFVRVADFVRDTFIQELRALGVNVKPLDIQPASTDFGLLANLARNNQAELIISGDLMAFDVNCHGFWTLECSRKVSLSLTLVDRGGNAWMIREVFDASMTNNEGLGVFHTTLLDQLTNEVLRKALSAAISRSLELINQAKSS